MRELVDPPLFHPIDQFVTLIAREKHGKADERDIETLRPVQILGNVLQKAFTAGVFGYFQQVHKPRFGKDFVGQFRHAIGRPPFVAASKYEGRRGRRLAQSYSDRPTALSTLPIWLACRWVWPCYCAGSLRINTRRRRS